jgi:REP element-mobilizing transposase RayT
MPKTTPLEYGGYYHIYNRGNNRENIFIEKRNYSYFLKLYAKHILPIADTYAYCLLKNHFHLLVRIKEEEEIYLHPTGLEDLLDVKDPSGVKKPSPSQCFSNLFNAYKKAINKAYNRTGALFQRPFRRIPVMDDGYFVRLIVYIHQNPEAHGMIEDYRDWPYSSYHALVSSKATHLDRQAVYQWFEDSETFETVHQLPICLQDIAPLVTDDFD